MNIRKHEVKSFIHFERRYNALRNNINGCPTAANYSATA